MECYKKTGLLLCGLLLMMQGCVTNNLDDCPDAIRYSLAFEYTLHTEDNTDRFYDVDKMFVYVFDATTRVCVYADTTLLGPFVSPSKNDFTYPLPLSTGTYNIIVWGWGRNPGDNPLRVSTAVIPTIVPNSTTIDDARLRLASATIGGQLERTFYSEHRNVNIPAFVSRIDTLPLMNISNMIRIVIPDAKTAAVQDQITISIEGDDRSYLFNSTSAVRTGSYGSRGFFRSDNNAPDAVADDVRYLPYKTYRTDSIRRADPINSNYNGSGRDSMLVVDISSLRLVEDNRSKEIVISLGNNTRLSLVDILQKALQDHGSSQIQFDLDRYHRWEIEFYVLDAFATGTVSIMDWHNHKVPTDVGGQYDK